MINLRLERRLAGALFGDFFGDQMEIRITGEMGHPIIAVADGEEAAGADSLPLFLTNIARLAGQNTFIEFGVLGRDELAINRDPIALGQGNNVAYDEILGRNLLERATSHYADGFGG